MRRQVDVWKTIKGYFWWTYPRGSVHYDVMVTLILAFIFLAPLWVDFGDKPNARPEHPSIVVEPQGGGSFVCEVDASTVTASGDAAVRQQVASLLRPITGEVVIDRYESARGFAGNRVLKVWVHR